MERMLKFWKESGEWANTTFGTPEQRGPLGPMKHIVKEAKEIQKLIDRMENPGAFAECDGDAPTVDEIKEELYDLQHLIFDAARRLSAFDGYGFTSFGEYVNGCFNKLEINKKREWPRFDGDNNEAVEHKR